MAGSPAKGRAHVSGLIINYNLCIHPVRLISSWLEQRQRLAAAFDHLIERALFGSLVRPPAQQPRAMAKAVAGEVVVFNFNHEFGAERLPFVGASRAPT